MVKPTRVFKFGGASVKDAEAIKNVGKILEKHRHDPLIVVVSATGKSTNALELVVDAKDGKEALLHLDKVYKMHLDLCADLFEKEHPVLEKLKDLFLEVEQFVKLEKKESYDFRYDQIVSLGELFSTSILAAYLKKLEIDVHFLDARKIIRTNSMHREGMVDWTHTKKVMQDKVVPLLQEGGLIVTQGFLGGNEAGHTTTLGREGSDFTAAIFAYCLDAKGMYIWKDVPGILTADPRLFKNVSKIDRLSYKEAIEMTYYGAKVIHPKTIKPLQNKDIPLFVKSFLDPDGEGTFISGEVEANYPPVIVVEKNQLLLHISTRDFSFVAEHHLSYLFKLFAELRIKVNMMRNTAISFTVSITNIPSRIQELKSILDKEFKLAYDKDLELITVRHFRPEMLEPLLKGKIVMFEERIQNTLQLVVKDAPIMERMNND